MRKHDMCNAFVFLSMALGAIHAFATDLLVKRLDSSPQVAIAAGWVGDDSDDEGDDGVGDEEYTSVHALASGTGGTAEVSVVAECPVTPLDTTGAAQCNSALIATLASAYPSGIAASFSDNFGGSSSDATGLFEVVGTTGTHGILKGVIEVVTALSADDDGTNPYETNFLAHCGSFTVSGWMDPENDYGWVITVSGPEGDITTVDMGTSANLVFATEEFVTVGNTRSVSTHLTNDRVSWNGTTTIESMSLLSFFNVEQTEETSWPSSISVDYGEGPEVIWSSDW